jgi:hypothetical protein
MPRAMKAALVAVMLLLATGCMGTIGAKTDFPGPGFTTLVAVAAVFLIACDVLIARTFREPVNWLRAVMVLLWAVLLLLGMAR